MVRTIATVIVAVATALAPLPASAATQPAVAAVGDSLTRGYGACGTLADCTYASWATGEHPTVDSYASRLDAAAVNYARSGAKANLLPRMADYAAGSGADTVTVLIGANDACAPTVGQMTPTSTFRGYVDAGLDRLTGQRIVVASVPSLTRLWQVGKESVSARTSWERRNTCQAMLAAPLSDAPADVARRAAVADRVDAYNQVLEQECAAREGCTYDGGSVHALDFTLADLSTADYFHLDVSGQAALAQAVWHATAGGKAAPVVTEPTAEPTVADEPETAPEPEPTPDTTGPAVAVTSPDGGSTVGGWVTFTAAASDPSGVTAVSFWSGGIRLAVATLSAAGWVAAGDTGAVPDGTYPVIARAVDGAGNVAESGRVWVRVDN